VTAIRIVASASPAIAVTATQPHPQPQPQFNTLIGIYVMLGTLLDAERMGI